MRNVVTYIFAAGDRYRIKALQKQFHDPRIRFSSTIPLTHISDIDAIYNTVMGYEEWYGGLPTDFRAQFQNTVIGEATDEMRKRGLPPYIIVGRLLGRTKILLM